MGKLNHGKLADLCEQMAIELEKENVYNNDFVDMIDASRLKDLWYDFYHVGLNTKEDNQWIPGYMTLEQEILSWSFLSHWIRTNVYKE